jgi:hypothetical protein
LEQLAQEVLHGTTNGCLDLHLQHLVQTTHHLSLQLQCHHQDRLPQGTDGDNPQEQQKKMATHFYLNMVQMKRMNEMV